MAAQAAKQKGNEAFAAGDFPAAIGHYTAAVLADVNNPIYPLNRAAAYLKLGKYQDAERDCTTVIRLDSRSPKAWYRRAQARQGLDIWDDALADFKQVLALEPANELVKQDIARVQFLITNGKKPTRKAPEVPINKPSHDAPHPKRRRVPIVIVDANTPPLVPTPRSDELMSPVSTRKLDASKSVSSASKNTPSKAGTSTPISRPGGGIFRRDGTHTLVQATDEEKSSSAKPANDQPSLNVDILPKDFAELSVKSATKTVPTSLYAFDRNWSALKTPWSRWQYLKQITPESLPPMFKTSLDTSMLVSLIQTFHSLLQAGVDSAAVKEYIVILPRVARWDTLTMLLSKAEKQLVKDVWDVLPSDRIRASAMSSASVKSTASSSGPTSTVVVDVLAGHLGHLTDAQQQALATFRTNLVQAGLYRAPGEVTDGGATHDEPTLLRFLRARRFDPLKAQKQFADAEAWRNKHKVDELYATFPEEEFEDAKHFYPRWTGRRDKKELNKVPPERRYQRIVALYEIMVRFVFPLCTSLPHRTAPTPVSCVTTIIDLEQVSLTSMWSLRHHLQEASTLATANYPETLNTIAVVNSPSFFPTVWGWIKGWFDEGTRTKIHVLGKDPGPVLRTLIDEDDLPRPYGGKLDWKFEQEPSLDTTTQEYVAQMPKGPVLWIDGKVARPSPSSNSDLKPTITS
ncbi:hypothetical protein EUX98_g8108 [Antrodiella citrinella]|uniref:RNA polymerase II-associated protein 3 n=1 Tax=Antrodiella citrinella TaxID=2447956 RepID=A0A4S4MC68_9APHY|nr:hypothetical protein EUX98_g8108 [Antrodiella citrinella]